MQVVSLDVAVVAEATCERAAIRALGIQRKRPEPPDPVRLCGWLRLDLDRTRRGETNGEDEGYAAKPHDPPPEEINGLILMPSCGQPRYVEAGRSCKPFPSVANARYQARPPGGRRLDAEVRRRTASRRVRRFGDCGGRA